MRPIFLTAEWRKLILINFEISPEKLARFVPAGTEIDFWNGTCYVSLVGFLFKNTRVRGFSIPFHKNFEEVNLRFYVKKWDETTKSWRRGVVFISEIVPKPAIAWVANSIYHENYRALPMRHHWLQTPDKLEVEYGWKTHAGWQSMGVRAENAPIDLKPGSEAEYIAEHFWGYSRQNAQKTNEYQVEHPSWQLYPIQEWACDVDFGAVYGPDFAFLNEKQPLSVFLAEGSEIVVRAGAGA